MSLTTNPHQTPSVTEAKTATPSGTEARAPGREVEPHSPATPSRPVATDRVTSTAPFTIDRTITSDDIHLVTVALTDDAARQLARDLTRTHMADLVLLARLTAQGGRSLTGRADAAEVETRLAGALTARMTTQWELTLTQAEQLLEHLDDAATEPEACLVGTCTGYATTGGYCGPHADGI